MPLAVPLSESGLVRGAPKDPFVETGLRCGPRCGTAGWGSSLHPQKGLAVENSRAISTACAGRPAQSLSFGMISSGKHVIVRQQHMLNQSHLLAPGSEGWVETQTSHVGACQTQPKVGLDSAAIAL